jgi:serine/threonine-protein kinase
MVGNILSHYKIIEKLGEGGMGVVYKAEDLILKRNVAIKILPSFVTAPPDEKTRFIHEARLTSALNHPNILTVHEFNESEGTAFLVTECVEGQTLTSIIQKGGLPISQVLDMAIQVAAGIAEAHLHGIVHRDIKPDNIMLSFKGQAKVMDFGLARLMGSSHVTTPGSLVGTFSYMSPEQINEEDVDTRSDIFSFGTLLYQMVTGEVPFRGKTVAEMLSSIIRKQPEPFIKYRNDTSPALEQIVLKALEKNPGRRYQSMVEMKADLERVYNNPSVKGLSASRVRLPGKTGISVTILIILIAIAGYYFWNETHENRNDSPNRSIAVLPFQNIMQDSAANFLSIGLADYVITRLTYIHSLLVKPTSSIASFEGQVIDAATAGSNLQADYVLEGRFQKIGERLHVNTQLVDVHTRNIVWADKIDLRWEDLARIQDNISERIVEALQLKLSESERGEVHKVRTKSPEAFEYYLRGVALATKGSRENNGFAIKMFERAISLDEQFAEACAGLSVVYIEQFWSNYSPDTLWVEKGVATAQKALSLDPQLAAAHSSLGFALRIKGKYHEGMREALKTLSIDPRNSSSLEDLVEFYRYRGEFDKALMYAAKALEYDPSFNIYRVRARIYQSQGKYQESISELRHAIQRSPNDTWLRGGLLAFSYIRLGDLTKAEEEILESERIDPDKPETHMSRAMLATIRGDYAGAERELNSIEEYVNRDYALARHVAAIYAKQRNTDLSLQWMEKATKLGNRWYSWYLSDSWFESVRDHPKFKTMMSQMKDELDEVALDLQKQGL